MITLGSLEGPGREGIARARVAKEMKEKRANLTRENMIVKVNLKERERLKAWGANKTNAEVFYSVFQSEIIQPQLSAEESGATKEGLRRDKNWMEHVQNRYIVYEIWT
jgi:hypothetical protein